MPRSKRASKSRKPNSIAAWWSRVDPAAARRLGGGGLLLIVCAGIAVGLVLLAAKVEARSRETLLTRPVHFRFDWPGAQNAAGRGSWLPESFQTELRHIAALHMGQNEPLSPDPLRRLGEALQASGWFDDRPTIRREPGGIIHISGAWRVPVAAVRVGGNDLPVSRAGKIMPIPYDTGESGLPVVYGMEGLPPMLRDGSLDFAMRWDAGDLDAGLELLDVLRGTKQFGRIAGVDVSEFGSSHMLTLLIDTGARVRWGGRVSAFNPAEVPTDLKLQRLALLFESGRLENATLLADLYHERGILVAPPSAQDEQ